MHIYKAYINAPNEHLENYEGACIIKYGWYLFLYRDICFEIQSALQFASRRRVDVMR